MLPGYGFQFSGAPGATPVSTAEVCGRSAVSKLVDRAQAASAMSPHPAGRRAHVGDVPSATCLPNHVPLRLTRAAI